MVCFMSETKEYIVNTSLLLFLQKSYKDVTMKDILDKTGLSKGAFYHHFASKEDLFKEIVLLFFASGQLSYSTFRKDSLQKFYQDYVESIGESISNLNKLVCDSNSGSGSVNFFFIMFEAVNRFPEFLNMELQQHKKDLEEWQKAIANARLQNEISSTSTDEEIANLFLYCTDGVFLRYLNDNQTHSYKEYLLKAFETVYNNLIT